MTSLSKQFTNIPVEEVEVVQKHRRTRNNRAVRIGLLLLNCVLLCGLLAGCGGGESKEKVLQNTSPLIETSAEDLIIHTSYGTLYYPECWREYVTIWQEQSSDTITVVFETKSGEKTYELFRILIGEGTGEVAGRLTDDDGTQRNVYLRAQELPEDSGLEGSELVRYYAMQEDLNYLIDHLS